VSPDSAQQSPPWLSIVGLGADGGEALSPRARSAIESAELVAGSARQLALVEPLLRRERLVWPSPLSEGTAAVLARRGRPTCVLASGDPFWFGIGATLAPELARGEFVCYPAPSSLSLAAARLGLPLQDTDVVSLHGRDLHAVIRYLHSGRRVLALSWDRRTPAALAALLSERGFGASRLHVLEQLGGAAERIRACSARDFDLEEIADLNLVAIEVASDSAAFAIPARGSLPDSAFEHDGQLTKQDVRAITLSALGPRPGELLWDVGAGAGSLAIEWLLSHPTCRAIAVERELARCERIRRNSAALGTPALRVVHAAAPQGLAGLDAPDAIFIGGGGADPAVFAHCWDALRSGGRLVMNAVALETEAFLLTRFSELGGQLRRISIELAAPLGGVTGWRPAMPVTQWRIDKP
jgi:precorrin-6Y C5,15-methyltransferase (decarboxylating)